MDVQAPVEPAADDREAALTGQDEPAAAVAGNSVATTIVRPPVAPRRLRRRVLPAALRRPLRVAGRWTHSPTALWLGSGLVAAATAAVVIAVVQVGIRGVSAPNTHYYYPLAQDYGSITVDPQIFPRPNPEVGPPAIELPNSGSLGSSLTGSEPAISIEDMSQAVLQEYDLDDAFSLEGEAPNGDDPQNGLLAAYSATYQRGQSSADQSNDFPGLRAVFSDVAVYSDGGTASTQMNAIDASQLGLEAGLPGMTTTPIDVPQIADETRAVRLIGSAGGIQVEVVVIQFRMNAAVGVVGAAAALNDDPDLTAQAVALAQAQQRNMLGLQPPSP